MPRRSRWRSGPIQTIPRLQLLPLYYHLCPLYSLIRAPQITNRTTRLGLMTISPNFVSTPAPVPETTGSTSNGPMGEVFSEAERNQEANDPEDELFSNDFFPTDQEVLIASHRMFGPLLPSQRENSSKSGWADGEGGDKGEDEDEGNTLGDVDFDLFRIMGVLQGLKGEISGIENEEAKPRMTARIAMGLLSGLECQSDVYQNYPIPCVYKRYSDMRRRCITWLLRYILASRPDRRPVAASMNPCVTSMGSCTCPRLQEVSNHKMCKQSDLHGGGDISNIVGYTYTIYSRLREPSTRTRSHRPFKSLPDASVHWV